MKLGAAMLSELRWARETFTAALRSARRTSLASLMMLCALMLSSGCFYPPAEKPPPTSHDELELNQPYDIAWDAVHEVIRQNKLGINADDPNQGIVETEINQFTLKDADCGELKGVSGKYAAEPDRAATAVYYFKVKPHGLERSVVSVQATFSAPLYVPLHPPRNERCVSRGRMESLLLKQIAEQAASIHRPSFTKPPS
jgi:hypothetical protein